MFVYFKLHFSPLHRRSSAPEKIKQILKGKKRGGGNHRCELVQVWVFFFFPFFSLFFFSEKESGF